jgi:hypothetical protein
MNDPLDDLNLDADHHDVLGGHYKNVMDDLNLDVRMGVSLCHRMNGTDDRNDLKMDVSLLNRNYVRRDQNLDVRMGVSLCHRMNGTDDRNDLKTDASRVNRNCVRHDRKMDENLDAMNHHVMLMVYRSKSCDRMSHDHLRCGHLKMRRRDMNRMDGKNLDGNHPKKDDPTHLRRVNRRMKGDHLMACLMKI